MFYTFTKLILYFIFLTVLWMNCFSSNLFSICTFLDNWFLITYKNYFNFYYFHQMAVLGMSICKPAENSGDKKGSGWQTLQALKSTRTKRFFVNLKENKPNNM